MAELFIKSEGKAQITQEQIETLLYDPVCAAYVFFKIRMDAFQRAALRIQWFSADTEDASGHGSSKTLRAWILANLSCLLIPNCVVGVIYQNHQSGRDNFWKYYQNPDYMTPLFKSQLGTFDTGVMKHNKGALKKEQGNWKLHFKSGGRIEMPAPGHFGDAEKLGSWEVNRMVIDEANKIRKMGESIEKQLVPRVRLQSFNPDHPVWQNKIWRMGTAETSEHVAFHHHKRREKEERLGDPTLYSFGFCCKDWSNLPAPSGKSWRDTIPNWRTIKSARREMSKSMRLAEELGVWAEHCEGWYTGQAMDRCEEAGKKINLEPVVSRHADPDADDQTHYFGGVDAARSENIGNDEGAIVVLRAKPIVEIPSELDSDWDLAFVYARLCLNHDGGKWAGAIHDVHRSFGMTGMLMDPGGSDYISADLKKPRQLIDGIEVSLNPIVRKDDVDVASGVAHFILGLTRRTDFGIRKLWPDLAHARGDDVLKYLMNDAFRAALDKCFIKFPPSYYELREMGRTEKWTQEMHKIAKLLNPKLRKQILGVNAMTNEKGGYLMTANNAVKFVSSDKDDFHDAARNAYVAFRCWLRENEGMYVPAGQNTSMFYGMNQTAAIDG